MGTWIESHDQDEPKAKISGPIGSREDIQMAAPALFEFGGGHLYLYLYGSSTGTV